LTYVSPEEEEILDPPNNKANVEFMALAARPTGIDRPPTWLTFTGAVTAVFFSAQVVVFKTQVSDKYPSLGISDFTFYMIVLAAPVFEEIVKYRSPIFTGLIGLLEGVRGKRAGLPGWWINPVGHTALRAISKSHPLGIITSILIHVTYNLTIFNGKAMLESFGNDERALAPFFTVGDPLFDAFINIPIATAIGIVGETEMLITDVSKIVADRGADLASKALEKFIDLVVQVVVKTRSGYTQVMAKAWNKLMHALNGNSKAALLELCQKMHITMATFIDKMEGPPHCPKFTCEVLVKPVLDDARTWIRETGGPLDTKKRAQEDGAAKAYARLLAYHKVHTPPAMPANSLVTDLTHPMMQQFIEALKKVQMDKGSEIILLPDQTKPQTTTTTTKSTMEIQNLIDFDTVEQVKTGPLVPVEIKSVVAPEAPDYIKAGRQRGAFNVTTDELPLAARIKRVLGFEFYWQEIYVDGDQYHPGDFGTMVKYLTTRSVTVVANERNSSAWTSFYNKLPVDDRPSWQFSVACLPTVKESADNWIIDKVKMASKFRVAVLTGDKKFAKLVADLPRMVSTTPRDLSANYLHMSTVMRPSTVLMLATELGDGEVASRQLQLADI